MHSPPAHAMSSLRTWVAWSVIAAAPLVSPVVALLTVIAAEALIDLMVEVGAPAIVAFITAGSLGWALFRKVSARLAVARQPEPNGLWDAPPIAAPRG